MKNIAILGTSGFHDYDVFKYYMGNLMDEFREELNDGEIRIITSNALGTGTLAAKYAKEKDIELKVVKPNYRKYGKDAVYVRNEEILSSIAKAFIFTGGDEPFVDKILEYLSNNDKDFTEVDVRGHILYR